MAAKRGGWRSLPPRWQGQHLGAWAPQSTDLAQACASRPFCASVASSAEWIMLGVSGLPLEQVTPPPGVCAVGVFPPDTQPLRTGWRLSEMGLVRGWPRGHVIEWCFLGPGRGPRPRLPPHSCSHRRSGHGRAGSGDRAPWQLCLPGISSFCSLRPRPATVTPSFLAGPSPLLASGSASIRRPELKRGT